MSKFGGGDTKCGMCEKTVYKGDSQSNVDGSVYHQTCFKCKHCNGQLTVSNYAAAPAPSHDLYCKTHFMQLFKRKGKYEVGDVTLDKKDEGGAGEAADVVDEPAAPVEIKEAAEGAVEAAAAPAAGDRRSTGLAASESMSLSDRKAAFLAAGAAPEAAAVDRAAVFKAAADSGAAKFGGGASKCFICTKSVYKADPQVNVDGKIIHKSCFKCAHCNAAISLEGYSIMNDILYCKPHFIQLFKRSGGKYDGIEKASDL